VTSSSAAATTARSRRSGLSDFTTPLNANPGVVITNPTTRSESNNNLLVGPAPLLFRKTRCSVRRRSPTRRRIRSCR
jgi:hypothetical protein